MGGKLACHAHSVHTRTCCRTVPGAARHAVRVWYRAPRTKPPAQLSPRLTHAALPPLPPQQMRAMLGRFGLGGQHHLTPICKLSGACGALGRCRAPKPRVLLVQIRAGGTGLNLQAASHAVLINL